MPIRTCSGCGARRPQAELLRFRAVDGILVQGAGDGRGAYACPARGCLERAIARRAFARRLRQAVEVPAGLVEALLGPADAPAAQP